MRLLVPLLLALLLAVPVQGASVGVSGSVSASRWDGGAEVSGPAWFFGVLAPDAAAHVEVIAASADVVVHRRAYHTPPGGAEVNLAGGGEETDESVHHDDVEGAVVRLGVESFLMGDTVDASTPSFTATLAAASLTPGDGFDWHRATDQGAYWEPRRAGDQANLEAEGEGTVLLEGDLVLSFFDVDLHLNHADGETVYRTGRVPSEDGNGATVEGEYRRVNVTLHDAVVTYRPVGAPHQAFLRDAVAVGDGDLTLRGAEGLLRVGEDDVRVRRDLHLDGAWTARLSPAGHRLAVDLEADARGLVVDGVGVDLATAAPASPAASSRWRWLAPLTALPVALWASHVVRRRRLEPDTLVLAADEDLGRGRHRRAAAWSRRALRRDPADADAAAIHVVALYRDGRHARGVAWLGAWLDLHDDPTGELTVLLGLGRLETEGVRSAARTVRPVLDEEPDLRTILEGTHA